MAPRDARTSLHRFGLARDQLTAAVGQAVGLTSSELEALEHIEQHGPLTQRQLADRLFLTTGGTTLLVDRLEARGLVSRQRHPTDRRAVALTLSRGSVGRTPRAIERYHATLAAATKKLSAPERDVIVKFLDMATAAAGEATDALRPDAAVRRHERRGRAPRSSAGRR